MVANPRRRHHTKHRRHHRNATPAPWHIVRPRVNYHRRRRNPGDAGLFSLAMHPVELLKTGAIGALSTYATIVVPNAILPFPGTDITAKVLRLLTRAVWGGVLHTFGAKFLPGSGSAILTGAMIGAGGGFVLDLFNTQVIVGQTDQSQTSIIPAFSMPTLAGYRGAIGVRGYGVYTDRQQAMPAGYGAYTRPMVGFRGANPGSLIQAFAPARRSYDGR